MRFTITARHFELTALLRGLIEKKLKRLKRFDSYVTDVEIVLSKDSKISIAEGRVILKKGTLAARAKSQDMYMATKSLLGKLEKQLERHDERIKAKKRLSPSRG